MHIPILLLATILLVGCKDTTVPVSETEAKIGYKTPDLSFTNLLNDTATEAQLHEYEEELLILDFWATWCGPCIQAFPKMEKLQEKFKGRVKVVAITDDPQSRIEKFLENKPLNFTVAIDEDRIFNDYFKHQVIPHYVILDAQKVVKAVVSSDFITEENITKLLAGENVAFTEKKEQMDFDENQPFSTRNTTPVYQSTLLPYMEGAPGMSNTGHPDLDYRIFAYNTTFPSLIRMAYQFPYSRTIEKLENPEKHSYKKENQYCYELIVPDAFKEDRLEIMKREIAQFSGLTATVESKMTDVYLLQKIENTSITIPESTQKPDPNAFIVYGQGITLQGQPMADLASFYENNLNKPVIDETGYTAVYDLKVAWFEESGEQSLDELTKYGLVLIKSKRAVYFLIISD